MKLHFLHAGIAAVALHLATASAGADALYSPKYEMVRKADAIAVVEIGAPEYVSTKTKLESYNQIAQAKVIETIHGPAQESIKLLGLEDCFCARCYWKEGKYLVFLRKNEVGWAGANWQFSGWKVTGENVEWMKTNNPFDKKEAQPLKNVLDEVRSLLKPASQPTKP